MNAPAERNPHTVDPAANASSEADVTRFDFRAEGNAAACCLAGWAPPERDERWATGSLSQLSLPVPGALPGALVLRLRPFVADTRLPAQRLIVSVNGEELAQFTIAARTVRAVVLPARLDRGDGTLAVTFRTPDAARPVDYGVPGDTRMLAVAFTSIDFQSDRFPAPEPESEYEPIDLGVLAEANRIAASDLMLQFESLGQNCEFGLVQRRCGVDPLGLLRFSSTPLPYLLAALEAGFAGMGLPESTEIVPSGQEYMVRDKAFGFLYHAWAKVADGTSEEVLLRELRRVPFLVRKLVGDLAAAEKIFLFRGMSALAEEEVFPLAVLLRRHGPNTLLFVTLADKEHPPGTVVLRAPGFLVGYIRRFAPEADAADFDVEDWVVLCRQAYRGWLAARAGS